MDASPDRLNYTRLKFLIFHCAPPEASIGHFNTPKHYSTISVKALSLFYLASLGLCLSLQGQAEVFSAYEPLGKAPGTQKSENLLKQGVSDSIEMLNPSDMTITESDQFEAQTMEGIGDGFIIAEIDENLSKSLENDEALWSQSNKEDPEVQKHTLTPLAIIIAITSALLLLGLTLIRTRSKHS